MTLLAVSKGIPAGLLASAVEVGLDLLGENRVQEAAGKIPEVTAATWHLVGRLQSNKTARAVELFAAIHSVDSLDVARRVDRIAEASGRRSPYPVFVQVNIDEDRAKAGFSPEALEAALDQLASLPSVELRGLMTIGRMGDRPEAARPTFARLRALSERLRAHDERLGGGLSMGMSHDFEVAVEEGATIVRIGRALFGDRPPP